MEFALEHPICTTIICFFFFSMVETIFLSIFTGKVVNRSIISFTLSDKKKNSN